MTDASAQGLLSLIRDSTSRAALEKYMLAHGVDPFIARGASIKCEKEAIKNGALGAAAMGLLGLFATAPVAGLGAPAAMTIGFVFGSGGSVVFSDQCKVVRDAAFSIVNELD